MWWMVTNKQNQQQRSRGALLVFRHLHEEITLTQTKVINAVNELCKDGRLKETLSILDRLGSPANPEIYASALQVCANEKSLIEGKQIHTHVLINGIEQNVSLSSKLVSMYANCGSMVDARLVFDKMPKQNLFSWNWMIGGYAGHGQNEEALKLYYQMLHAGVQPNKFTFPCVLKACVGLAGLQQGQGIHDCVIRSGFESDIFVANALIDMYAKCGNIKDARHLFDKMSQRDVASWTTMIGGYTQSGNCDKAFDLFQQMELAGVKPNEITWNAMITGYAQNGHGDVSSKLFFCMQQAGIKPNVITWNAMIAGYNQNGHGCEALNLFRQMQFEGMKPNTVTIASVLPACALISTLQQGKQIHNFILRRGFESNVFVENALIDMYAKCGSIEDARQVFDNMSQRTVVSWNAMIACYGMHGHGESAIAVFDNMQQAGMAPNHITLTCVLSACSHAGLVDEGWQFFNCMTRDYCITCSMEHYACMVDLLGRAGCLVEAHDFIKNMPLEANDTVWGALLGACKIHRNMEVAECVIDRLFELKPQNTGVYVLMSNIYAAAGRWDDVARVRKIIRNTGLKKKPGCSWIEVKNKVHTFIVGDRSHPETENIYATLQSLAAQMEEAGYVPETNFLMYDLEVDEKERILCGHSERLAIAFGLMHALPGTAIRVSKNLRVCGDCHTATKFISKIVGREIIMRDANRFHHFKDGLCSCGDFW